MSSKKSLEDKCLDFLDELLVKIDMSIATGDTKYVAEVKPQALELAKNIIFEQELRELLDNEISKVKLYLIIRNQNQLYLKNNLVLHTSLKKDEDLDEVVFYFLYLEKIYSKNMDDFFKNNNPLLLDVLNRANSLNIYYYLDVSNSYQDFDFSSLSTIDIDDFKGSDLEITKEEFDRLNFIEIIKKIPKLHI